MRSLLRRALLAAALTAFAAAPAAAAGPLPGAFQRLKWSELAGVAVVRSVTHPSERVERATLAIDAPIVGSVEDGRVDVVHRRRFPSDPGLFRTGSTVVIFAMPLPADSEWSAMRAEGASTPLHVPGKWYATVIPADDAPAWSNALGTWQRVHARDPHGHAATSFLLDQLAAGPPDLSIEAARTLYRAFLNGDPPTVEQLVAAVRWLTHATGPLDARRDLATAVAVRMPAEHLEELAPLLEHPELRGVLLSALVPRAKRDPALRMTLATAVLDWAVDPDPLVRRSAIELMALDGTPEAVEVIGSFALSETEHDVAAAAVHALDELRATEPSAYDGLGRVARDAPASTAALAMERLAVADDPASLDALLGVFESPRTDLHAAAVIALMNMNQPRARETVLRLRDEHPDPRVRRAVAAMVGGTH